MLLLQHPNLLHQLLLYLQLLYLLPLLKHLLPLIQPLAHQFLKRAVERKTM